MATLTEARCSWCEGPLPAPSGPGRPRTAYCTTACRRTHRAVQHAVAAVQAAHLRRHLPGIASRIAVGVRQDPMPRSLS